MNRYSFELKYKHIARTVPSGPVEAESVEKAIESLASENLVDAVLVAQNVDGCWKKFEQDDTEINEYTLARKIGDARFGSECQHARAKRGYCPDCLRRVI